MACRSSGGSLVMGGEASIVGVLEVLLGFSDALCVWEERRS